MKFILVSSHPRSGTHFLINSILSSSKIFEFPLVRPSFLSFENLILSHDDDVYQLWKKEISKANKNKKILIFKTHCTPYDINHFIKNEKVFKKEANLIKFIFKNALVVNIRRDVLDTLKSWYFLSKSENIVSINAASKRHQKLTFSNFIRLKNLHKINYGNYNKYDENIVKFLKYHHHSWLINKKKILSVDYESLKNDFSKTIEKIIKFLIKNNLNYVSSSISDYNINNQLELLNQSSNKLFKLKSIFRRQTRYNYVYNQTDKNLIISKTDQTFIKKNYT